MNKRKLVYLEDKNQIIGVWNDKNGDEVVLVTSVKDCTIMNDGQD